MAEPVSMPRVARPGALAAPLLGLILAASALPADSAAQTYARGQNVAPAYEGWEQNEDGSFNFLFGYMNRNWGEEIDVPVGEDNMFSPGPADRGQPTHFLPRRNRFVFKVRVPADWGDRELVWTLTSHGVTEKAYATLRPDYIVDNTVIMSETGALGAGSSNAEMRSNEPPTITLEGERTREAIVGQPVTVSVIVEDDGLLRAFRQGPPDPPETAEDSARVDSIANAFPSFSGRQLRPPSRVTVQKVNGLFMSWFVYRGEGEVTFDPPQVKVWEDTRTGANSPWAPLWRPPDLPEDGRWTVTATFPQPGTYILRGRADDGGLFADEEITIVVRPAAS
ncbi:hypothetical protein [Candidatus Palauibacter sp.]|uniref:hypothetical protein n=1 Tax=Candidatus Palauibacter sp. TaxID=3101350 RepID=UPI003D0E229D